MATKRDTDEKKFAELYKTDPERAEAIRKLMKEQPENSWDNYLAQTEKDPVKKIANKGKPKRTFLEELFDPEMNSVFLDPESEFYFNNLDYDYIKDAGIKAGVVNPIPANPTEEQKQKQRDEVGRLYAYLNKKSTDYQSGQVAKEDTGWLSKLFGVTTQRAREKAAKGEGPTGWTDFENMDAGDIASFLGDYGKNVALGLATGGAGEGTLEGALESAGLGYMGAWLDSYGRDKFTKENLDVLDYLSNGAKGAMAGAVTKNVLPGGAKILGDNIKNFGFKTKANAFKTLGEFLEDLGLASAGQKVDLSKYGKGAAAADAIKTGVLPMVEDVAPAALYSGADIPLVGNMLGSPIEISLEEEAKDLKKRKPEAWRKADMNWMDYDVKDPFTPDELAIYNAWRKKLFEKMLGGTKE